MQIDLLSVNFKRRVYKVVHPHFSLRPLVPLLGVVIFLVFWQAVYLLQFYPPFIIPSPLSVVERFVEVARDGRLWLHTSTTLTQMGVGFVVGSVSGVGVGYFIAKSELLEALLSPLVVAMQSTPIVAYAPLLVIWFGSGPTSKIISSALIVFFPLLLNTVVGVRGVPEAQREIMRAMSGSRWQTFIHLEVPAALPILLGGLKVSATLAVIGAVVGEFVSANAGLGFLINRARFDYDTPLVFVAILMLAVIARTMYSAIAWIERRALFWRDHTSL